MAKIRLAIAGVGNCANSLVQGLEYYRNASPTERVPGLMHVKLADYHIGDIEVVAAFDVDNAKVGQDLAKAIWAGQNNTLRFANVNELGIGVMRAPTLDGLGKYYRETIEESPAPAVDVAEVLKRTKADVLVSYLPVGSELAQKHYAEACLDAKVGFVNAIPVFIASDPVWAKKFSDAGIPIIGDDIKSQLGSTIAHRCWPGCSKTVASCSTGPTSSISVAIWTSRTCWSVSAWSRRRFPRPRPSPVRSSVGYRPTTYMSAHRTTSTGSMTASGRTSGWKGEISATYPSTSN